MFISRLQKIKSLKEPNGIKRFFNDWRARITPGSEPEG
jgi:hypothetical protein